MLWGPDGGPDDDAKEGHRRVPVHHLPGGFAKTKGPAVCGHATAYRQERLEGALLAKFREAMTPRMIDALTTMVNAQLEALFHGHTARAAELSGEIERLEGQAHHLVRFLAVGDDSPTVRTELRSLETRLAELRAEQATIEAASVFPRPRIHPAWVMGKLERLDLLLRQNPQRAKVEILKHLDGGLVITPQPSVAGMRVAEISGRARSDSLLSGQEAVRLQVVAGARNHRNQLASPSSWTSCDCPSLPVAPIGHRYENHVLTVPEKCPI